MDFFKKPTVKEQVRKQQRELRGVQRDLQREDEALAKQEKKLEQEIKQAAKQGNQAAAKSLAKQLIRVRKMIEKSMGVRAQVSGVSHRTQAVASNHAMAQAMSSTTKVMKASNKATDMKKLQSTMMQFEKESTMMDMKEELMNDTLDNVMEGEDDELEGEEIMNQVLEEIGIEIATGASASKRQLSQNELNTIEVDEEMEKRLARLKDV